MIKKMKMSIISNSDPFNPEDAPKITCDSPFTELPWREGVILIIIIIMFLIIYIAII